MLDEVGRGNREKRKKKKRRSVIEVKSLFKFSVTKRGMLNF